MTASTDQAPLLLLFPGQGKHYHRPLIPIVAAMAAGIWGGGVWPGRLFWIACLGLPAVAAMAWDWYHRRTSRWTPLFCIAILGYALISPWRPAAFPDTHISHFTDTHSWHIEGTVVELLPPRHERTRVLLEVTQLKNSQKTVSVSGRIRVTVVDAQQPIRPGAQLRFASRIRSFRNFNNPGAFDYRRYMAFQRIHGSAFVRGDRLSIDQLQGNHSESILSRYRMRARDLIEAYPDKDTQAVLKTLLIGEREAVTQELRRIFNRCGVGHLLAISGLHIGIVGGLCFAVFLQVMHRVPFILDRGWGRRGATLAAFGPVVFYASLSGLSPATQRALIMVLAFMATYFIHRDGDTLNFLALAALLMLIVKPPALFSISFQMSFAAVFWIVLGMSYLRKNKTTAAAGLPGWMRRIQLFALVTFWATAGTLPFTMRYFQEISLIGLAANCLVVPIVGFLVLPVGLVSLFLLAVHEGIAGFGITVAGWGLEKSLHLLHYLSAFDVVAVESFVPTIIEMVWYYGVLSLLAIRPAVRSTCAVALILLAVLCGDGLYWIYQRFWHQDLRVTVLDVGQGSAALIEFPGGETMLIDGGGYTDNRYFDIGARVVAPFLRRRKVMQIDTVVLSHPSSDHMNGLVYVLTHFHPRKLLWTGDRASTESFRLFYQELIRSGAEVESWQATTRRLAIGGVVVEILNPPATKDAARNFPSDMVNNRSIVLKLTLDVCAILFTGDIEARAEIALTACCGSQLPSQILVVPHHGSRTSSTVDFIDAVDPQVAIFSVGWRNRFGFPHATVLERYQRRSTLIRRTDRHGAIQLRTHGRYWKIEPHLGEPPAETQVLP